MNPSTFKNQDKEGRLKKIMREEYIQAVLKDYPDAKPLFWFANSVL